MKRLVLLLGLISVFPLSAQQATAPPALELALRCTGVETGPQSRAVKSAAYGFGNPTHPDEDEFTKHVDRTVLIELHGNSGRIHLPQAVLAVISDPAPEGWYPLTGINAAPDAISAQLKLNATGQSLHIDRRSGAAELLGYGSQPLKGVCRLDNKPRQF